MKEARVVLRRWGVSDNDIESLASILRSHEFDVEVGLAFEKGIDPVIVAGILFAIQVAADESLRELVRLTWRTVLDRIRLISEKTGPTRVDVDFHSADYEFRVQARTNEPDALKWLDRMVTRLSELGIASVLSEMPKGTFIASADRDITHGEEFIGTYAGGEFYRLDLSSGKWVRGRPKPRKKKGKGPGLRGPA